jgi:hypothetical protein
MKTYLLILVSVLFFAKSDAQIQNWAWAKGFGSSDFDFAGVIAYDSFYDQLIVASKSYTTNFVIDSVNLSCNGSIRGIISCHNTDGTLKWAQCFGNGGNVYITSIKSDQVGNIYVGGTFSTMNTPFTINGLSHFSNGADWFICKYDHDGNLLWAKVNGGSGNDEIDNIAIKPNGDVLVSGVYKSTDLSFAGVLLPGITGVSRFFIGTYDQSGNEISAYVDGGSGNISNCKMNIDQNGFISLTGNYSGNNITIQGQVIGLPSISNTVASFVARFNSSLNLQWMKVYNGTSGYELGIDTDADGNLWICGSFKVPILEPGGLNLINSDTTNSEDCFYIKFDQAGNVLLANSFGGVGSQICNSIRCSSNKVYLYGSFSGSLSWGSFSIIDSQIFLSEMNYYGFLNNVAVSNGGNQALRAYDGLALKNDVPYVTASYINGGSVGSFSLPYDAQSNVFIAEYNTVVGYPELNRTDDLKVIPNPGTGIFKLTGGSDITHLIIYNSQGSIVDIIDNERAREGFKIKNVGVYFVQLHFKNTFTILKLVVL